MEDITRVRVYEVDVETDEETLAWESTFMSFDDTIDVIKEYDIEMEPVCGQYCQKDFECLDDTYYRLELYHDNDNVISEFIEYYKSKLNN